MFPMKPGLHVHPVALPTLTPDELGGQATSRQSGLFHAAVVLGSGVGLAEGLMVVAATLGISQAAFSFDGRKPALQVT